jgi:hypothetical protein
MTELQWFAFVWLPIEVTVIGSLVGVQADRARRQEVPHSRVSIS